MRLTQKYKTAIKLACSIDPAMDTPHSQDEIYEFLQNHDYLWDSKTKSWSKKVLKPSIFDNPDDGFVRIRIMAHPDNLPKIEGLIDLAFDSVIEVSKPYPNREDVGQRVYLLVKL